VLSTLGASNTFVGIEAGANNTTGYNNTFLGKYAGHSNTEGYYNTFSGCRAGYSNTKGYRNTFLGQDAGYRNTEGNFNTFLGCAAGYFNAKGAGNVFIGYQAGYNETGSNKLYIANSDADTPLIYGDFSTGNVGIGTTDPQQNLSVWGGMNIDQSNSNDGSISPSLRFGSGSSGEGIASKRTSGGNQYGLDFYNVSVNRMSITSSGKVGIGTDSPAEKLTVRGNLLMENSDGTKTVRILAAEGPTNGAEIKLMKADGTTTIELDAEYDGDGRIITQELQITGGSDLSEQFEVSDEGGKVKPGMVVCIDADNPGDLVVSKKTYDRTVAGGAGGVKPGMLMGQKGTKADGEHPVALTGRVYCWADASNGSIEPGALLTTSDMAGHAMKVTDYTRAQGAILGKAMSSLESGKGLVLVLVSLQ
jgi:hypothetical protein